MLVVSAIGVLWVKHLFGAAMFSGIFSFLSALLFVMLDAVDVAFTEAAVGAGVSTILVLATIILTKRRAKEWKASENLRPVINKKNPMNASLKNTSQSLDCNIIPKIKNIIPPDSIIDAA